MPINFNQYPYNDDYLNDTVNNIHTKNFHRILFKPGVAVQARELTQTQSILQDQIKKFGDHIFKNHSIVSGGGFTIDFEVKFLKLNELDVNNQRVDPTKFIGGIVTNLEGTVEAKVVHAIDGAPPTLILAYFSSGQFDYNDQIFLKNSELTAVVIAENSPLQPCSGSSSIVSVDNGVFYIDGYFVDVFRQTIAIDEYSNNVSARLGLSIEETIVTSDEDSSLLDPALGASNFQAPGADRYKIYLKLTKKPLDIDADKTFIEMLRLQDGKLLKSVLYSQYSEIDKYFARRTFDTNGNFIVDKFNVNVEDNPADANTYLVKMGPGKAYINGFIVENQSELVITANKARTNNSIVNKPIYMNYGNYLYVDNLVGGFDFNDYQTVDFHCVKTADSAITSTYRSTLAATGKIKNMKFFGFDDETDASTYVYETYVLDLQSNIISAVSVGTARANTSNNYSARMKFPSYFSNINGAYTGAYVRINDGNDAGDVLKITDYDGATNLAYLEKNYISIPEQTCNVSILFSTKDFESIYNSNTTVVQGISNGVNYASITNASKIPAIDSGDVYLRSVNDDDLLYELGREFVVEKSIRNVEYYTWMKIGNQNVGVVMSTPNDSVFSFLGNDGDLTGSSAAENFIVVIASGVSKGNVIPFSATTAKIAISSSSKRATVVDLSGGDYAGLLVDVYAKVKVNDPQGNEVNLSKKTKTLVSGRSDVVGSLTTVTGDSNASFNLEYGQFKVKRAGFNSKKQSLYVADVLRIVKIIDTQTPNATITTALLENQDYEITGNFILDGGQTDHYYDHASIKMYPNAPLPKGDVVVIFDYFSHEGNGYFDASSYTDSISYEEIPQYRNNKGVLYELRDCVDFRKTRAYGNKTFSLDQYGSKPTGIPVDGTAFELDFSYYLGRKDLLVAGKDGDFSLIEGAPSLNPVEPNQPTESMTIANFDLDPYTVRVNSDSRGSKYASIRIKTMVHKRWRMEDITLLEDRVSRVEYYTTLNSLEQSAKNLQIPDETGANRFKNGILTDDFSSYVVSDFETSDFYSSIQTVKGRLFAIHNVQNFDLTLKDTIKTLGVIDPQLKNALDYSVDYDGDDAFITLPYAKVTAAYQPYASAVVNINPFNVIDIEGEIALTPKMDAWISSTRLPDIKFNFPAINVPQSNNVNRTNSGDYQTVRGADSKSGSNTIIIKPNDTSFDGFITDASLYPWIRGQQLTFVASRMKKNTLVGCYFDGKNVTGRVRETNTLWIDTANSKAFVAGSVISPAQNLDVVYQPVGKILFSYRANTYTLNGVERYVYECDVIQDLDIEKYTGASNTIQSVYMATNGISTNIKGTGTVIKIERKSGRIMRQTGNTFQIRRFYGGESNNISNSYITIISEGVNNANVANGDNSLVFEYQILSTKEYDSNNTIEIVVAEPSSSVLPGENYNQKTASQKKNYVYNIKYGNLISTNKRGVVCGVFYLPKDTYHTGDRILRIDNRVAENPGTETTFSQTTFFASNLNYNKRGIEIDVPIIPGPPPPPPTPPCDETKHTYNGYFGYDIFKWRNTPPYDKKIVTGFRLRWKISTPTGRTAFNKVMATNYPVNVDEFDSDTIVMLTSDPNSLSMNFDRNMEIVYTYYQTDAKCATPFKKVLYHDPVAQTFIFWKDEFPYGCFVKSIKTFFRSKPDDDGQPITCYLTDTVNGVPSQAVIPHATKTLYPEDIKISDNPAIWNASTYTEFEFPIPIYVKPDTMYAFILKTDSNEYEAYTARLGDLALPSSTTLKSTDVPVNNFRISTTPYIGELFKSQNAITWTSDGNEDLMFEMKRCEFDISKNPKVEFVVPERLPQRKLADHTIDFTYGANTDIEAAYTSNTQFVVDAFDVSTTDLTFTEAPIKYSYRSTLKDSLVKSDFEQFVSPGKYGSTNFQEIMLDDGKGERVLTPNTISGGAYSFSLYADIKSNYPTISPMISETGLSLFGIQWKINDLGISNTDIRIANTGGGYSNPQLRVIRTSNNVISNTIIGTDAALSPIMSGGSIVGINVLEPGSQYATSPIIEIIDDNKTVDTANAIITVVGETENVGGNGVLRYITQPVTLTEGFDAGDLRVYYTAYRPLKTNIHIYYKILNRNDTQAFEDSSWQLMTTISGGSTFSKKRDQLYEYVAAPYIDPNVGVASNKVSYTSDVNGQTYNSFYKFAIKVVMTSPDPTTVPYLKDIRGIALLPIG